MEPVYRVLRREPGTPQVERVDRLHLLSVAEREEARRERERKREDKRRAVPKPAPKDRQGGVDYTA